MTSKNQEQCATVPSATSAKGQKGFRKGASGNPKGRPKGSLNKATLMAQALFDEQGQAIVRKIIELALEKGDLTALKICLDRLVPPRKAQPVTFPLPEIKSAADIVEGYSAILLAVSRGELAPEEARIVADLLELTRRALNTSELEFKVKRLQEILGYSIDDPILSECFEPK